MIVNLRYIWNLFNFGVSSFIPTNYLIRMWIRINLCFHQMCVYISINSEIGSILWLNFLIKMELELYSWRELKVILNKMITIQLFLLIESDSLMSINFINNRVDISLFVILNVKTTWKWINFLIVLLAWTCMNSGCTWSSISLSFNSLLLVFL